MRNESRSFSAGSNPDKSDTAATTKKDRASKKNKILCISINGCANQYKEHDNKYVEMIYYPFRYSGEIRQNNLMLCLLDFIGENQNNRWLYGYTTDNSEYTTISHKNTKIHTKCEAHEAKCDKSGNCCNGASDYR